MTGEKNPNVTAMNTIIAEWKNECAKNLSKMFPGGVSNPEKLAKQSWTDIIGIVYKLVCEWKKDDPVLDAYTANSLLLLMAAPADKLRGFSKDKNVYDFYKKTFGPALDFADSLMYEFAYPKSREYVILPKGTPFNDGLPVSLRYITPCAMEMNTVIKNPDAHRVNDILCSKNSGIVVIKAVPELPNAALEYATQNNIKVY